MVRPEPGTAIVGEKPEIVGVAAAGTIVKANGRLAVPPGAVTAMGPLAAPVGTVTVIWVEVTALGVAGVPLNTTVVFAVVPKPDPAMVIVVPGEARLGVA